MTPTSYVAVGESTSPRFCRAFASGCGGVVDTSMTLTPGPVALFGSPQLWPLLVQAQHEHRTWYYGDHGYFGRGDYFRITRNAYQHDGSGQAGPDRFWAFRRQVQPWRRDGRHILVCPQSAGYFRHFGLEPEPWIAEVSETLRTVTDRPIISRRKQDSRPIAADLEQAWAVVTFSSAAALDALIAGVPVFVLAPFASAYRMGCPDLTRIEQPAYPENREQFLWNLAANQWTLHEIANGTAWHALSAHEAVSA